MAAGNRWCDMQRQGAERPHFKSHLYRNGERQSRVRSALCELPPGQALVIKMSFFQDRPHSEIATAFNLPPGTVKSRLRLALRWLRAIPFRYLDHLRDARGQVAALKGLGQHFQPARLFLAKV